MTFLIIKIAVYLVVALALGVGAGWVTRHVAAQRESDAVNRQLNDNRAKVPQLESLIRVRDDEIKRIKLLQDEQQAETQQAKEAMLEQQQAMRAKEVEIARLKAQVNNAQSLSDALEDDDFLAPGDKPAAPIAADPGQQELVAQLNARIETLELELADARFQLDAAEADSGLRVEMDELTNRLRQKAQDFERLTRQMDGEKRKVAELERERELQNKSLQVLHQQLEMERTGASAEASSTLGAS